MSQFCARTVAFLRQKCANYVTTSSRMVIHAWRATPQIRLVSILSHKGDGQAKLGRRHRSALALDHADVALKSWFTRSACTTQRSRADHPQYHAIFIMQPSSDIVLLIGSGLLALPGAKITPRSVRLASLRKTIRRQDLRWAWFNPRNALHAARSWLGMTCVWHWQEATLASLPPEQPTWAHVAIVGVAALIGAGGVALQLPGGGRRRTWPSPAPYLLGAAFATLNLPAAVATTLFATATAVAVRSVKMFHYAGVFAALALGYKLQGEFAGGSVVAAMMAIPLVCAFFARKRLRISLNWRHTVRVPAPMQPLAYERRADTATAKPQPDSPNTTPQIMSRGRAA
jgi:hypothetical protein